MVHAAQVYVVISQGDYLQYMSANSCNLQNCNPTRFLSDFDAVSASDPTASSLACRQEMPILIKLLVEMLHHLLI